MNVIMLAAGFGSRLKNLTEDKGKALVKLNGKPLIDYALEFTNDKVVEQRVIIGGYYFSKLEKHVKSLNLNNVKILENKHFDKGSILTLLTAVDELTDDTLIMNIDHVYNPEIFKIVKNNISGITAIVDHDRNLTDDDMKVKLGENGKIKFIDKKLKDFDLGYIGMTTVSKDFIGIYREAANQVLKEMGENVNVESILQYLADNNPAPKVLDVSSLGWLEIDNQDELAYAEKNLKENSDKFPYFT